MPGPTTLTTPNDSSITLRTFTHICNKVPIGYNGTPCIHPQNCPFPRLISTPSNTPIPRPTQLTTPNGIQIQSAVFLQFTHQTDRHRKTEMVLQNSVKCYTATIIMTITNDTHTDLHLSQQHFCPTLASAVCDSYICC